MFLHLPSVQQTAEEYDLLTHKNFSKGLGQNFLFDIGITRKIVEVAGPLQDCDIVEIGPGPGGLTRAILEASPRKLFAIEKDSHCVQALQKLLSVSQGVLQLIQGNAQTIKPQDLSPNPLKLIANLPYNIGTNLLIGWLKDLSRIVSLTLMFQKEVALRITAEPGNKNYGRLSVLCQYLCLIECAFDLPPHVFKPAPKVFSSVVHFTPKSLNPSALSLIPHLEFVTRGAFGQRRKMIRVSLKNIFGEQTGFVIESMGLSEKERPENLTIDQYIGLAEILRGFALKG